MLIDQLWFGLAAFCAALRAYLHFASKRQQQQQRTDKKSDDNDKVDETQKKNKNTLQLVYLMGFLLFKAADWMQGPYLYNVYESKVDENGQPLLKSPEILILMLTGFASSAVFSSKCLWLPHLPLFFASALPLSSFIVECPGFSGVFSDRYGRKRATLALAMFTVGSATSVLANHRVLWYLG